MNSYLKVRSFITDLRRISVFGPKNVLDGIALCRDTTQE